MTVLTEDVDVRCLLVGESDRVFRLADVRAAVLTLYGVQLQGLEVPTEGGIDVS